jgi:hypothetical protein
MTKKKGQHSAAEQQRRRHTKSSSVFHRSPDRISKSGSPRCAALE